MPTCGYCPAELPASAATGRPRRYCDARCRNRAYQARRYRDLDAATLELHAQADRGTKTLMAGVTTTEQDVRAWAAAHGIDLAQLRPPG
jgi:hypothetical protein